MPVTIVSSVFNMLDAFTNDTFGNTIVSVCVMGACIGLFRVMRRGAGG